MSHGSHCSCLMCSMAKGIGMMEKHPKDCNCQKENKKEERQDK